MDKPLTNADILASQGLVEVYDPTVQAYRQVKIEDAQKMVENLEALKASLPPVAPVEPEQNENA